MFKPEVYNMDEKLGPTPQDLLVSASGVLTTMIDIRNEFRDTLPVVQMFHDTLVTTVENYLADLQSKVRTLNDLKAKFRGAITGGQMVMVNNIERAANQMCSNLSYFKSARTLASSGAATAPVAFFARIYTSGLNIDILRDPLKWKDEARRAKS
jgi:hypothetical protein